ncbi:MAG: serine/threonine-protein kinase [Bryobacter sp.]|nr:serine/threonine-protein kinase [Bryobacter sp.]
MDFMPFYKLNAVLGITAGLVVWHLSRRWRGSPARVVTFGLAFQILASFQISLAETAMPFMDDLLIRGHSAVAMWITMFVLVAPVPYRRALPVALLSALMVPLAMALNIGVRGHAPPSLSIWALWCAAPFLMAILATTLAKSIYQMGQELEQAKKLGSYQLLEQLGQGGMGAVWRAQHRYLARSAAVKLIHARGQNVEQIQRRFEREAQAIARLECPHTVSIYDFGLTPEGQLYFAMELIRGLDLDQLVRRFGPQGGARVRHILLGCLRSLEEAHAAGLVHRDIKPSNILLGRLGLDYDFVKVVDFGLVKVAAEEGATQITMDQQALGTPAYMAPEVATGDTQAIDGRADLYSLGCVAYWLLTGRPVFEGPSPMAVALKHVSEVVVAPSQVSELPIDKGLEAVLLSLLEKNPAVRPASARLVREALEKLELGAWDNQLARDWWEAHMPGLAKGE